ncbi:MAG: hypothetical protein ACI814_005213, partial [Mariniblastus sp.]
GLVRLLGFVSLASEALIGSLFLLNASHLSFECLGMGDSGL